MSDHKNITEDERKIFNFITYYSKGNPGAMSALAELLKEENSIYIIPIAQRLHDCPTLKGSNLWVLWSDLGHKSPELVSKICKHVPKEILAEACSRQDYSGRKLIEPYLNKVD